MSESKPNHSGSSSGVEIEAKMDSDEKTLLSDVNSFLHRPHLHLHHHHKETHGNRDDIDEKTPLSDVKAPNVLERTKEEIDALFHHEKKESHTIGTRVETKLSESKVDSVPDKDVKVPNIFERVKEEIEAIAHKEGSSSHHHKETHGLQDDIDKKTPLNEVKAPNVFERAKEEIEAVVQTIHPKKESQKKGEVEKVESKGHSRSEADVKHAKPIETVKHPSEADKRSIKSPPRRHHKETHGRSDDIDENTQIEDVKAPNVFERAKEELEALVEAIHPKKKESNLHAPSTKSEGGFKFFIGRVLEKICRPWSTKRD